MGEEGQAVAGAAGRANAAEAAMWVGGVANEAQTLGMLGLGTLAVTLAGNGS
jgi:hypothetical protein